MINMHCRWPDDCDCKNKSDLMIIVGCLNQHITELPLCQKHYGNFTILLVGKLFYCSKCGTPHQDYEVADMEQIADWWKQEAILKALTATFKQ